MLKNKKIGLISLLIFTLIYSCTSQTKKDNANKYNNMVQKNNNQSWKDTIEFDENIQSIDSAVNIVDQALKKNGDFGSWGDLTEGLEKLSKVFRISIKDGDDYFGKEYYKISLIPVSKSGHGFTLFINKKSLAILPPPIVKEYKQY